MAITVLCACGIRVRGEERRLKARPPCPSCGAPLPRRAAPKEVKRVSFGCLCGLEMTFPWSRGGMWFECPQCGRRSIIPGRGSSARRPPVVELPEPLRRPSRVALVVVLAVAAVLAAIGVVIFV